MTGYASIDKPWLKYYTEEDCSYSIPKCRIADFLFRRTEDFLDYTALDFFGRKISYAELRNNIEEVARALSALGIEPGEIVGVCLPNIPEMIYLFYAINKIGAVANMLPRFIASADMSNLLRAGNTKWLFITGDEFNRHSVTLKDAKLKGIIALHLLNSLPQKKHVTVLQKTAFANVQLNSVDYCTLMCWAEFMEKSAAYSQPLKYAEYQHNAPAVICYTSGTTGRPSGVLMSDYAINAYTVAQERSALYKAKPGESIVISAPPSHFEGISNMINAYLNVGLRLILLPQSLLYDTYLHSLKYKPNYFIITPTLLYPLMEAKEFENLDLSFVKAVILSEEKLDITLEQQFNNWLLEHGCRTRITKAYGMTEVGGAVSYTKDAVNNITCAVGIPFINSVVAAFTETNHAYHECKIGEQGELAVLTPQRMLGYFASASAHSSEKLKLHNDGDIWVHTGDIGHIDENGNVFIDGRIKRIFSKKGVRIIPEIISSVIAQHPAVMGNVIVCAPNPIEADTIIAYIVKSNDVADSAKLLEEIKSLCKEQLGFYEIPDEFRFIDSLPLTPRGKIDYRSLETNISK